MQVCKSEAGCCRQSLETAGLHIGGEEGAPDYDVALLHPRLASSHAQKTVSGAQRQEATASWTTRAL